MLEKTRNYDLRKSRNGRWFDQKCHIDVLVFISDVILNYESIGNQTFRIKELRNSEYAKEYIKMYFSKPDFAENEYDKLYSQPIKLLTYAGILEEWKEGKSNVYKVKNKELLKHISISEKNSLAFLNEYIENVLRDSGLLEQFELYFQMPTEEGLKALKNNFIDFTILNSKITKRIEPTRIFNPLLNIMAFTRNTHGSVRGRLSKHPITFDELLYNKLNFRDKYSGKPKNISRAEFEEIKYSLDKITQYNEQKLKTQVRNEVEMLYHRYTEVEDEDYKVANYPHIHHILPKNMYPEFSAVKENLIALTPTQHLNFAHPQNDTQQIDKCYQLKCLESKLQTIILSQKYQYVEYEFDNFKKLLKATLDIDDDCIESLDFNDARMLLSNRKLVVTDSTMER